MLAYLVALCAAAAFAVATSLEHRSAGEVPDAQGLRPRQLASFLRATLTHPWWLAGTGFSIVGFSLHALALHSAPLAVVQPLLVCSVVFALALNHRLRGERSTRTEMAWALALVTGLAGFLVCATAGVPASHQPADRGPAVAAGLLVVAVVGCCALAARRGGTGWAAALLGAATGVVFASTATLLKACTDLLADSPVALLTSWQLYALLVSGAVGIVLNQLSFQAGPLATSLPVITVVDPLTAVLLGVVVYDENLRHTPLAIAGEVVFLGLLALAAIILTHREQTSAPLTGSPGSMAAQGGQASPREADVALAAAPRNTPTPP
jgi:hypothetical protein